MSRPVGFFTRIKQLFGGKADAPSPAAKAAASDPKPQPGVIGAIKEIAGEFSTDDGMTQAAALAFYTGLSVAPLLSIAVWLTQIFVGDSEAATKQIVGVASTVIGAQAAEPLNQLIGPAADSAKAGMTFTGLLSLLFLVISASGVFGQLQSSLNIMWNVRADPQSSGGLLALLKKRLFSFGMLFTLLFLMLVSMVASFVLQAVAAYFKSRFGESGPMIWGLEAANLGITFVVAAGVFLLVFKYLPDVRVPLRDTVVGAMITAGLFIVGKFAIGLYLGRGSYETSYGAAIGSFVALLVWVYYTSVIIFLGAETTQVYARRHGHEPVAEPHAIKTVRKEQVVEHPKPVGAVAYGSTVPVAPEARHA